MHATRTPVIAGNWKMNLRIEEAVALARSIHFGLRWPGATDVIVAPTFIALQPVAAFLRSSYISVAAQNMHWEEKGAFTGEIAPSFLKDAGAEYVLLGHSERRQYFNETDDTVHKKVKAAFRHALLPIVCIGETLDQREKGEWAMVVEQQVTAGLTDLSPQEAADLILAYEPVWAINTGKTATPAQAEEVHAFLRQLLERLFSPTIAQTIRILYGGSVTPKNSRELLSQPNIDGALVGGAALRASDFIAIIQSTHPV